MPTEHVVTPDAVASPNLALKLYGGKDIEVNGDGKDSNNPVHLWTGICTNVCAAALRDKDNYVDLTGLAMIRWNVKMDGYHLLRPIIKLADGTWLVGDHTDGYTADWHMSEIGLSDVKWRKLDIDKVIATGRFVDNPDLSKVDEIGFTDLMPGGGHGQVGWADVAEFEVYGKPVKRDAATMSKEN